jgi:AcrR family transcriptional regulator
MDMAARKTPKLSSIGQRRQLARDGSSTNYRERRQALLSAAAGVFQAKGFQAVRMDDVAEQLEVDRATLYYYFGNKQQLFREVIIEAVEANVAVARAVAASDEPARNKLRSLLVWLLDSYERSYPLLFVYVQEDMRKISTDDSPESVALVTLGNEYEDIVKGIVRQGIAEGEFRADVSPSVVAYALIGAANWTHRWYKPEGELTGIEVGEQFAKLFLDGLLVGTARRRARPKTILPVTGG